MAAGLPARKEIPPEERAEFAKRATKASAFTAYLKTLPDVEEEGAMMVGKPTTNISRKTLDALTEEPMSDPDDGLFDRVKDFWTGLFKTKKMMSPPSVITPQEFIDDGYEQHIANRVLEVRCDGYLVERVRSEGGHFYQVHLSGMGVYLKAYRTAELDITYLNPGGKVITPYTAGK